MREVALLCEAGGTCGGGDGEHFCADVLFAVSRPSFACLNPTQVVGNAALSRAPQESRFLQWRYILHYMKDGKMRGKAVSRFLLGIEGLLAAGGEW